MAIDYLTDAEIRERAGLFLATFNSNLTVPVPIDLIAERDLGVTIYPFPNLERTHGISAYVAPDRSIAVDQHTFDYQEQRFRFSVAHELSHIVLHGDLFGAASYKNLDEYFAFQRKLSRTDHAAMESEANRFAGFVLVPPDRLQNVYEAEVSRVPNEELHKIPAEMLTEYIASPVARTFNVSTSCARVRIAQDGLRQ